MYKPLLLACLAACSMHVASAQSIPSIKPDVSTKPVKPQGKTNGYHARLAAQSYYTYELSSSAFEISDSTAYTYSNDRSGSVDAPQYDNRTFLISIAPDMVNNQLAVRSYDTAGNVILEGQYQWDFALGAWQIASQMRYSYAAGNIPLIDSSMLWDATLNDWITYYTDVRTYDANGLMTKREINLRNSSTGDMDPYNQMVYAYDANGNNTEAIFSIWNGTAMKNAYRYSYLYNSNNVQYRAMNQAWNNLTNMWMNSSSSYSILNSNDMADARYDLVWNEPASYFDTMQKVTYVYNANNDEAEVIYNQYDVTTEVYTPISRHEFLYDVHNNLSVHNTQSWNTISMSWELTNSDSRTMYYWEEFTPSAVAQLKQQGGKLSIYPVPANNTLNIDMQWDKEQTYNYLVADMQGRILMHGNSNQQKQVLDVAALPAGNYNLILKGDKGGLQHSKFTVVK